MDDIKKGDVVELKSGSPKMTVNFISTDGKAVCTWYDFNTHTWRENIPFSLAILKISG